MIAGDSIQNAMVARERRNALVFWNTEMASRSIDKLLAIGDVIYPGHDLPFRVGAGGRMDYLHDFGLTLTGVTTDQPGLVLTDPGFEQVIMDGIEEQRLGWWRGGRRRDRFSSEGRPGFWEITR